MATALRGKQMLVSQLLQFLRLRQAPRHLLNLLQLEMVLEMVLETVLETALEMALLLELVNSSSLELVPKMQTAHLHAVDSILARYAI